MSRRLLILASSLAAAAVLSACNGNLVAPSDADLGSPAKLIGPNGEAFFSDSVDANGNTILIQELAAGSDRTASGEFISVASITVRSFIPNVAAGSTSGACITSTILRMETTPGNTLTVKKAGGCDKDIQVVIEQKATKRKATFKFSMVFGKTVIDSGLLN